MGFIRALRDEDDRSRFHSGQPDLDRFFHSYAGQNQFHLHISVTYVYEEEESILGFVTVAAGAVDAVRLPKGSRKLPSYPTPLLRLARMAVDRSAQGKGIGFELLGHVIRTAVAMSVQVGCAGILVDSKPGAVAFYRRFGFEPIGLVEGEVQAAPAPVPLFLSLARIKAAAAG